MEIRAEVRLEGLEERLNQVGPKLAKSKLRKALRDASKIFEDEAKSKAPVDKGDLRDSIDTVVKLSGKFEKGTARVGPTFDKTVPKGGKQDQSPGVYGLIVEFGNKRQRAQPFMRPAFDSKQNAVLDKFIEVLASGLEEACK